MAEILQDRNGKRTVQLSLDIATSYDPNITITAAHLQEKWVDLVRIKENQDTDEEGRVLPNEKFHLTFEEMNALGQAWGKFQFDLMIAKEAEETKLQNELAEAQELAAKHGITVELNSHYEDHRYYIVRHPDYWRDDYVLPEHVLSSVKQAVDSLEARKADAEKAVDPTPDFDPLAYDL